MYKIIIAVVGVLVIGLGYLYLRGDAQWARDTTTPAAMEEAVPDSNEIASTDADSDDTTVNIQTHTVIYAATGYNPKEITVKAGDTVIWINQGATDMWTATAMHPTHTGYPGSDISKCGQADTSMLFDACAPVKSGEAYMFRFNEVGTWRYHDHLNVRNTGTIIVTE